MSQPLPAGTHLAYTVYDQAEWGRRLLAVEASPQHGEPAWAFHLLEDQDEDGPVLKLEMLDETWQAFAQIPGFFAALAEGGQKLAFEAVVRVLDSLGAVNETDRARERKA